MCGICEQTEIIHSYEKTYGNESVTEPRKRKKKLKER